MLKQIEAIIRTACLQDATIPEDKITDALAVLRGDLLATRPGSDEPQELEPVVKRQEVARLLGISVKGVDYHAQRGRLVRVMVGTRACGFTAESVRKLMSGEAA